MILTFRKFVFATGLTVGALSSGELFAQDAQTTDGRLPMLKNFFAKYRSPLAAHAGEFLTVSDKFGLDWRLMPSLAIVETGGRNLRNNNVFGWGNGASRFRSVVESITVVGNRLANEWPYRGKTFEQKMLAYNPRNRNYAYFVSRVMEQVAPASSKAAPVTGPAIAGN